MVIKVSNFHKIIAKDNRLIYLKPCRNFLKVGYKLRWYENKSSPIIQEKSSLVVVRIIATTSNYKDLKKSSLLQINNLWNVDDRKILPIIY